MNLESCFIFDEEKIIISPDLYPIIAFLQGVEKEITTIIGKTATGRALRSEMICIFANLEVLFCLFLAYEYKTSDTKKIIKLAMSKSEIKKFLQEFCLSSNNEWVKRNPLKAQKLNWKDLRDLRNSLTHFYAVGKKISIIDPLLKNKAEQLEKKIKYKVIFLSPIDLWEIVKGVGKLMIKKWGQEFHHNKLEFQKKIRYVKEIIERSAPVIVKNKDLRI